MTKRLRDANGNRDIDWLETVKSMRICVLSVILLMVQKLLHEGATSPSQYPAMFTLRPCVHRALPVTISINFCPLDGMGKLIEVWGRLMSVSDMKEEEHAGQDSQRTMQRESRLRINT